MKRDREKKETWKTGTEEKRLREVHKGDSVKESRDREKKDRQNGDRGN